MSVLLAETAMCLLDVQRDDLASSHGRVPILMAYSTTQSSPVTGLAGIHESAAGACRSKPRVDCDKEENSAKIPLRQGFSSRNQASLPGQ